MDGFGAALRTLRNAANLTQAGLSARIRYSEQLISHIEAGRRRPTTVFAAAADEALDAGGLLADLAKAQRRGDMVYRRSLLAAVSTLAGLGVVSAREVGEAVRTSMMATLGADATVEDWVHIADEYGRDYMTVGAPVLQRRLAGDLIGLRQHIADNKHPALRAAAARIAVIYGMTEATTGTPSTAVRWYRTARAAADASGDLGTRVWARGREAFTRSYEGAAPDVVLAVADDAVVLADGRPSLGLLEAHLARSHAYAAAGADGQALAAIADAQRIFSQVTSDDAGTVYAMPAWRMAMACSLTLARVGRYADADRARQQAQELRPAALVRWGVQLDLHRALVAARQGDPDSLDQALAVFAAIPAGQRSLSLRLLAVEILTASGQSDTVAARALLDLVGSLP